MFCRINPFETYVNQNGQSPLNYQHQNYFQPSQHLTDYQRQQNLYNQQYQSPFLQFFQSPGQQPMVYHPNTQTHQYISPRQYYNPRRIAQTSHQDIPQSIVAQVYSAPEQNVGFDRGNVEAHPVRTYTAYSVIIFIE